MKDLPSIALFCGRILQGMCFFFSGWMFHDSSQLHQSRNLRQFFFPPFSAEISALGEVDVATFGPFG